ncbi:hypothetical protein GCM10023322_50840 [Rugosimonospora acidiphila]|uniref:Transposase DDE domain-containing protein n=1 Tax=Rugosimonospora acidiphila TaxID=556531 RepID=A0ABP9S9H6_9ACTN
MPVADRRRERGHARDERRAPKVTSLAAWQADGAELSDLIRGHRAIEDRLHYVGDVNNPHGGPHPEVITADTAPRSDSTPTLHTHRPGSSARSPNRTCESPRIAALQCYCVFGCGWVLPWQRAQTIAVFRRLSRMAAKRLKNKLSGCFEGPHGDGVAS